MSATMPQTDSPDACEMAAAMNKNINLGRLSVEAVATCYTKVTGRDEDHGGDISEIVAHMTTEERAEYAVKFGFHLEVPTMGGTNGSAERRRMD